jgi:hypothetical protein
MTDQIENYTLNKKAWLRYLARTIDMTIGLFVTGIVVGSIVGIFLYIFEVLQSFDQIPELILIVISILIYFLIEAKIISKYATTPAKKLLGISIVDTNGEKLDYKTSLIRNLTLWLKGLGLTIPFISLIALIMSYNGYVEQGTTPWDKDNGVVVQYKPIGTARFAIGIILGVFSFILNAYFSFQ